MNPISSPEIAPQACAATLIFGSEFPRVKQWFITKVISLMQRTITDAILK